MDDLIPWLAFGLPILITLVVIVGVIWLIGKPAREMKKLEERAAAGDPEAQVRVKRAREMQAAVGRAMGGEDPERKRLLTEGRPARATIQSVRATGLEISAGPSRSRMVEVVLSVQDEMGPREITVRDNVDELHLGRLLKGASVPVRVDPMDPQKIAVLWDTL